jgi:hypothetical protein
MRARTPVLVAAALAAAGCSEKFAPESYLHDLRVLALVAEVGPADPRTEVGPGDPLTVTAYTYAWPGDPDPRAPAADPIAEEVWSFCPLTSGATTGYACVVPACEVEVARGPSVPSVTLASPATPYDLALACLQAVGSGALPPGASVPDMIESVVRYRVRSQSGKEREAVQRVPLWTQGPPPDPNLNPAFRDANGDGLPDVEIGGVPVAPGTGAAVATVTPGGEIEVTVHVDPASVQTYVDATGRTVTESIVVFFYSTAGRFDFERASGPDAAVKLQAKDLEAWQTSALLWAVARDLRGGQAVAGPYLVTIQ